MSTTTLTIRLATDTDADRSALARLAALDSRRVPTGTVLLGEVDGRPRAAVEVDSGAVVADPFHPTADVVDLLRLRATRLRAARAADVAPRAGRARRWRSRATTA